MVSKTTICSVIIILFHIVGLYGFLTPSLVPIFKQLVPFHLLLMLALLFVSSGSKSRNIVMFYSGIYLAGFFVEVLGVNTGLIFGEYRYGATLGLKLWNTPVLIGVNWLILVYSIGVVLEKYQVANKLIFATIGAVAMVLIDFLIEPVAVKFDYWSWSNEIIPLQNYLGWFIVSFIMFLFFSVMEFKKQNPCAIVLLVSQAAFFLILNTATS